LLLRDRKDQCNGAPVVYRYRARRDKIDCMTRFEALILRAAAAWTVFIWATRIRNILEDPAHSTRFKLVHSGLAAVSIVFALAILYVASRNRRRIKTTA
jgi:hypothetical protein